MEYPIASIGEMNPAARAAFMRELEAQLSLSTSPKDGFVLVVFNEASSECDIIVHCDARLAVDVLEGAVEEMRSGRDKQRKEAN